MEYEKGYIIKAHEVWLIALVFLFMCTTVSLGMAWIGERRAHSEAVLTSYKQDYRMIGSSLAGTCTLGDRKQTSMAVCAMSCNHLFDEDYKKTNCMLGVYDYFNVEIYDETGTREDLPDGERY